jgi:hypothetical protein
MYSRGGWGLDARRRLPMMLAIRPLSFFPSEFVRAFLPLPPPLAEPQKKSQRTLDILFFLLLG